jgi:hypothetical protein
MSFTTTVAPNRRQRQSRRRQTKPEFYAGQRLLITRHPWQTSATRMVEVEDVREVSHADINPAIPPSYLYHLRSERGLTIVTYTELKRRVVEVL